MNPLEILVEDLTSRQRYLFDTSGNNVDKRNKAWELAEDCPRYLIELTYGVILSSLERRATLGNITKNIGSIVMRRKKMPEDPVKATHLGFFILVSYFETGILTYIGRREKGKNGKYAKHKTYYIQVKDLDAVTELMSLVSEVDIELFPMRKAPKPWEYGKFTHSDFGIGLIKHAHKEAIRKSKINDLTFLIDTLNKLGNTGWRINSFVFEVFKKTKRLEKNPFKFSKEVDKEKKESLIIEIDAIEKLAEKNLNNVFYHIYNVDFRGRIYPNTAFLHEQSSDNAKGLLLLDEAVPLGEEGYYWLCVHTANMYGNDKVSLDDRVMWVQDNFDSLMSYVNDPYQNDDWMNADKPLCFLACCYELSMLSNWHGDGYATEDFPSCLPIYIDGSNNGVQHLVAMSKDEKIAPLVNLVPQEVPGDVYMYIAEAAIEHINNLVKDIPEDKINKFDNFFEELSALKKEVSDNQLHKERFRLSLKKLKEFRNHNFDYATIAYPIYWSKITDPKVWRKTLKRNVMTLAYGGTARGMGQQIIDDTRSFSEYHRDMEDFWGRRLGADVHALCYEKLKGPANMLKMFEALAAQENDKDKPITYNNVITNFPFVHSYREPEIKRVNLYYGEDRIRLNIQVWQEATLKKSKQKTGASPNIVHSLDAVHLSMVIHDANYLVTVVHDSFGCHAGNMGHMFNHVRDKFVELYNLEPLTHILSQMGATHLIPEKGTLNVEDVIKSDFAFA